MDNNQNMYNNQQNQTNMNQNIYQQNQNLNNSEIYNQMNQQSQFGSNINQGQNFQTYNNMSYSTYNSNNKQRKNTKFIVIALVVLFIIFASIAIAVSSFFYAAIKNSDKSGITVDSIEDYEDDSDLVRNKSKDKLDIDKEVNTKLDKPLLEKDDYNSYINEPEINEDNKTFKEFTSVNTAPVKLNYFFNKPEELVDSYLTGAYIVTDIGNAVMIERNGSTDTVYLPILAANNRGETVKFEFETTSVTDYDHNELNSFTVSEIILEANERLYTYITFEVEHSNIVDYDDRKIININYNYKFKVNDKSYEFRNGTINRLGGADSYFVKGYFDVDDSTTKELIDYNFKTLEYKDTVYFTHYYTDSNNVSDTELLEDMGFEIRSNILIERDKNNTDKVIDYTENIDNMTNEEYVTSMLNFENIDGNTLYSVESETNEVLSMYQYFSDDTCLMLVTSDGLTESLIDNVLENTFTIFGEVESEDIILIGFDDRYSDKIDINKESLREYRDGLDTYYTYTVSFKEGNKYSAVTFIATTESRRDKVREDIILNLRQ